MSKTEQAIIELLRKWYSSPVAMPRSFSDTKYLENSPVSYKTYAQDGQEYLSVDITVDEIEHLISLKFGKLTITSPISKGLSGKRVLEILTDIYTEAISLESIAEGRAKIRQEISEKKANLKTLKEEISKLEDSLREDK